MTEKNRVPTFNMKVVVQETGLSPDTLRAWERRYGMPAPERTEGGHRLYSQYEIDMLRWLIARQEEGLSISHAVDLWRRLEAGGGDPLETGLASQPEPTPIALSGSEIDKLQAAWLEACLNYEEQAAQYILAQAFALFPVETVCFEILQRSLQQIGQGWYEGVITVQQEHFASALALRQLEALLASMSPLRGAPRLLVACPPQEQHTFSPLMLTLMFRRRSWNAVYLGANVPVERLEAALQTVKPQLVILVAQTFYTAGAMLEMANLLQQEHIPLAYGGAVFNTIGEIRRRIPGHFLGTDLRQAPEAVAQIVQSRPPIPEVEPISETYRAALIHYREQRPAIEAHVHQAPVVDNLTATELSNANRDLGNNLEAALALGNIDWLKANIEWVQGLFVNYHDRLPAEALGVYLSSYYEGIRSHLDERGKQVIKWFKRLVTDYN